MENRRRIYSTDEERNQSMEELLTRFGRDKEGGIKMDSRNRGYHQSAEADEEENYKEKDKRLPPKATDASNEEYVPARYRKRDCLQKSDKNGMVNRNRSYHQTDEYDKEDGETIGNRGRSYAEDIMEEVSEAASINREPIVKESSDKPLKKEDGIADKDTLKNDLPDKAVNKGNAYSHALELLDIFDFAIREDQLYVYCEEEGYWRFLSSAEENRGLRALVPEEMRRYINRSNLTEIYEWLRTCANKIKEDSANIYLLNFKDTAYNWKTGDEKRSRKKYGFRYVLQVKMSVLEMPGNGKYDKFLHDIFGSDETTIREFNKFMGLCLCDIRYLKLCFFLYGPSNTGKSIILNILKMLIGDEWSASLSFAQMGNEFAITQLLGKRINLSGEVSGTSNKRLDIFKSLTGNDKVTACYKGKDHFQFYNRCLLVFACNSFPHVDVVEEFESFLSRVIIFPFTNVKPREEWIEGLERQIIEEDAGSILRKAIEGLKNLEKDNFCFLETEAMKLCKRDFQGSVNSFALFAAELLERETESILASEEIAMRYKSYCRENELQELPANIWGPYLQQVYGCRRRIIEETNGLRKPRRRAYQGVKFIEEY